MKLQGQVAIITGAGSGIGREIAKLFVQEGAKVLAADINLAGVESLIAEISATSDSIQAYKCNVSSRAECESMIDFAIKQFGKLNILCNNAGILDKMTPITEVEDDLWDRVMQVNLNSVMYTSRYAIPLMVEQGGGKIVNTASVSGLASGRGGSSYTASKFAVVGLTKNIGFTYAPQGIRCNAICPGDIQTNISADMSSASQFGLQRATSGLGSCVRRGEASEVAHAALFLASDDSSFVNGTTLTVDGGWTAY